MMRCWWIRRDLTALIDGELKEHRVTAVRDHLARCAACAREHGELDATVARLRQHLPVLFGAVEVAAEPLLRQVRRQMNEKSSPPAVSWLKQPVAVAAIVAATLVLFTVAGVLEPVLIAMGVQNPPEVLVEEPEMFRDYAMFEHLEAIENFDAVLDLPIRKPANNQLPHG
jgi:anti-sigma factor RsiW